MELPQIRFLDPAHPDPEVLGQAALLLQQGQLVAFPTETVYGLGANALDSKACQRIFEAKGRPSTNPLIVHVADIGKATDLCHWTPDADRLARHFWPGPLTLVLKRKPCIPDEVTAGGDTVAVRIPNHPVALALIRAAGLPLAAPSANRSNAVSPTLASHVVQSLGNRVPLVLDGGACSVGIESTVVDLTSNPIEILRPGHLSCLDLEKILEKSVATKNGQNRSAIARSPGQLARHYSPQTPLEWFDSLTEALLKREFWVKQGEKVLLVAGEEVPDGVNWGGQSSFWAQNLYRAFHEWDAQGWDRVILVPPQSDQKWAGVLDRIHRAAQSR